MSSYILDTDHISLAQQGHSYIGARILATPSEQLAVSIVTFHEQMRGRLAQIQQSKNITDLIWAYRLLHDALNFYTTVIIVDFDQQAGVIFNNLRQLKLRIGTMDLRIAAIALATGATVVTRNRRDFEQIPGLVIEDWSEPR